MKKVTFKILSMLCFVVMAQMSFAQISCLPEGGHVTLSADNCDAIILSGDALTPASEAAFGGSAVTLFEDEAMTQALNVNLDNNAVSSQYVDQTVYVVVTNDAGQSCWTTIIPEDKTDPIVECPDNIYETCVNIDLYLAQDDFDYLEDLVVVTEACGPVSLELEQSFDDVECGDDVLTRTITATDGSGNTGSCTYTITFEKPSVDDVDFPSNKDGIEDDYLLCDAGFATDANGHPSPSVTGYPQIDGVDIAPLSAEAVACELGASYEDVVIEICEGTTKYLRTWTVLSWCPTDSDDHVQVIKVVDEEGPSISGLSDITISTDLNSCTGSAIINLGNVSDNCSGVASVTASASAGTLNSAGTAVTGLPLGTSTITIVAVDGCGNESTDSYDITVEDNVNPIAVCETFHTVGLTIDEPTLVDALVFDDGSTDNCEIVDYEVRRMDNPNCPGFDGTPYGPKAPFYCCDVAGGPVMVELRVTDASGNTNSCMVEVEVQDKLNPIIECPADKELDCYEDPFDTDLTGYATAYDNCGADITSYTNGSLDNCGEGTIYRIFIAADASGNTASCAQRIDVINSSPFSICDTEPWNTPFYGCDLHSSNDGVEWPADVELSTCGAGLLPEDLEGNVHPNDVRPRIFEDGCDLVGVTYEDVVLPIQPDACVKVIRNWKVYNWCVFDADNFNPNNPQTGDEYGYWEYVQIIKVLTTEAPVIDEPGDQSFCSYDDDCATGYASLVLNATDDCTPAEDLNYYYWIDAFNDGSNDIHAAGNDASGTYPLGTHRILWHVEDGCGNVSETEYLFVISDCKKPTPYAYNGLAIELMPNVGEVELWATDFDAGSFDNCGIQEFRINSPSVGPGATVPPAGAGSSVTFTCETQGTQTVDLWVLDVNGNWDYVSTYVIVQDNMFGCDGSSAASIAGTIENEEAITVEGVEVSVEGDAPGIPDAAITGATGDFAFPGLAAGANYTVEAANDVDPLNGVTTFDLVLMSKHILGIQNLDSPYKLIAADVNKSGSITTFDMVQLRKLILFIDTEFQSNTSWRFVDADFVFPNAANPFETAFPEVLNFNNLAGEEFGDFVAVKVGDVNCSAQVNGFTGSSDDRNANGEVVFGVKDQALVAGETYTVDFTAADFAEVLGYQFSLAFDNNVVEFVDVETSLEGLTADNFGMSLINEGVITTSWNSINAVSLDADAKVFSMTFVAKTNAQLSDVIAVNSRYTKAEAYDNNVNLMNIGLSFNGAAAVAGEFELYQNQPNPFKSETVIGFNLPEAGTATLSIYDVAGKVLKVYNNEFAQGYNEVQINRSELSGAGVLYYQLDTENFSATKKMILVK